MARRRRENFTIWGCKKQDLQGEMPAAGEKIWKFARNPEIFRPDLAEIVPKYLTPPPPRFRDDLGGRGG